MGALPFPVTFLHGLIYGKSYWRNNPGGGITYVSDKERHEYELGKPVPKDVQSRWEKMSKTKGNIIDPLEIIESYGTDAMRMALCASSPQSREIDLDLRKIEEFKNFANKVWNGARFVFMNLEGNNEQSTTALTSEEFSQGLDESALLLEDHWLLSVLNRTIRDVNAHLQSYLFDQAALEAYDFFWKEFCSYYVEISKPVLFGKAGTPIERKNKQKLLVIALTAAIRLIHPMAPFITEELFQAIKDRLPALKASSGADVYTQETVAALQAPACIVAPYPQVIRESDLNPEINQTFELVGNVVYTIRNIRGEVKLPPGTSTDVHIVGVENDPNFQKVKNNLKIVSALIKTNILEMHTQEPRVGFCSIGVLNGLKILIPIPTEFLKQEKTRLQKEKEKLTGSLEKLRHQLANTEFVNNAPAELIEKQRKNLSQLENELAEVSAKLQKMN
jgi:valyl-tRNA synthetase